MFVSIIDLGTNTILMVTARIGNDGAIDVLGDEHGIARLGRGVDASRMILPEAFDRVEGFLLRYREISQKLGAERIVAIGTSALRDAANRDEFIVEMTRRTGITIETITGAEEAELTYLGASFGMNMAGSRRVVLDIGGGSTEIALGNNEALQQSISLDIGAVRLTERFLQQLPPLPKTLALARAEVAAALADVFDLSGEPEPIGVAGTVTTLGAIDAGLKEFRSADLDGWRLSAASVSRLVERLSTMTLEEIAAIPQIPAQRADVILGGSIVLEEFLRRYGLKEILVSTRGLRYGLLTRTGVKSENVGFAR